MWTGKKNISDGLYELISRRINIALYKVIWRELWHEYDVQGNATSFIVITNLIVSPFPFTRQRKTVQRLNFPVSD